MYSTVYKRTSFSAGPFLLFAYLVEGIIGKSYLERSWGPTWRMHQAATVLLTASLLVYLCLAINQKVKLHQESKTHRIVKLVLLAFVGCGLITNIIQESAINNTICFVLFAGMIVVLGIFPQVYFNNMCPQRVVEIVFFLLVLGNLGCIVTLLVGFPPPMLAGRLCGIYNYPILSSRMITLCILVIFWRMVSLGDRSKLTSTVLALSIIALFMTRTRTAIASLVVSSVFFIAHRLIHKGRKARAHAMALTLVLGLGLIVLANILSADDVFAIRTFLRVAKPMEELVDQRMSYWEGGVEDLHPTLNSLLGQGYLAAFGGGKGSFKESHYDRDSNRHNMFLSCAQSYGLIGLCLFYIFLSISFYVFITHRDSLAALGMAILVYVFITGVTGNCLLSFGDPADRFAWFLLGICLFYSDDANNVHASVKPTRFIEREKRAKFLGV